MDLSATQVYEDENLPFTQTFSHALEEEELVQVGTLSIDSKDYQIKTGTTKIGRLGSCHIVINDTTVSKLHAEIEASRGQGSTWISDLNSSNKTKLNNLILRPTRLYELKEGSIIEFGRVRATYHTYCPVNDTVIPETPVPRRQKIANAIIPNTPDSSFDNSADADDDGLILGTQKDDADSVFRRPRIPQSTCTDKKNTPTNKSNDTQTVILDTSSINVSKNEVSIFDAETQKFEDGYKMASRFIHDTETQKVPTDISEHLVEANAKIDNQLPELNIHDKTISRSVMDIQNIETQCCMDDINEMEIQKKINIQNTTGKKFITDIYAKNTQDYTDNTSKDGGNIQKPEISKNNNREKNLAQIERDIHDLETQKFDNITKDISDLETQLELGDIARCDQSVKDISDIETQFISTANETSNDRPKKDKDKDGIDTTKDGINHENITKSPKSRSSSPGSLNLSSPGVEDCPSSPLNQSGHLLESTYLLEFFGEGIDKQERMQTCNVSTSKPLLKTSLERNSDVGNVANNEENNDEDIFEAPTQRNSRKLETVISNDSETNEEDAFVTCTVSKKKRGKLRSEQTNDDSETDAEEYIAELAKKQRESLETLNKLPNEDVSNRNDPGTSIESEDMFDVLTQQLNDPTTKDTSNSSINQQQKPKELNRTIDDMAPTQIINNVDQDNQTNIPDIDDAAPTQRILSRETSPKIAINSKDFDITRANQSDMATTHIINAKSVVCTTENLDCENIDYELAPTQVIGETEVKEKRDSNREKNSQVILTDALEQKLSEMFDNVNNDINDTHESQHMSTQYLENILESSQCDDSINKSNRDTDSTSQKQLRKRKCEPCNQHSPNLLDTEVNANNVNKTDTDSQNSDVSTTRRRRNILRDTQEFVEDITPRQSVNSSRASKDNKKAMDDNTTMEFNKRRKRNSETKNKSDGIMETLNDDNKNKTISNQNNERSLRSSRSIRQKNAAASEMNKQGEDPNFKVNDAEENTLICTPCSSENEQRAQTLYESDDDILTRLPAIRISGTLSNPASPSASSTSTVHSTRYKQNVAKDKRKERSSFREKSLSERDVGNLETNDKPLVKSRLSSVLDTSTTVKVSGLADISEDSETDSETKYKRFQQMADRMLGNEFNFLKRQDKGSRKNVRVLSDVSEDPKQNMDVESKNSARTNSRMTRNSSRQNESSHDLQRKARVRNTAFRDRSTDLEAKSAVAKRKIFPNMVEESVEKITSKKRKTVIEEGPIFTRSRRSTVKTAIDRQSPNIPDYFTKRSLRGSSPIIENTKSSEDNNTIYKTSFEKVQEAFLNTKETNGNPGKSNEANPITRTKHMIYNRQISTHDITANGNSKKNKPAQTKGTEMQISQLSQDKVLRIMLSPIKSLADDESQEVERIMAKGPSNVHDKNLSIRESSKANLFQRELRSRRKRSNSDIETDSALAERDVSSEIGDSDNTQLDKPVPRTKRGRFAKSSVLSLPEAQVSKKKETFKKPTRMKNSTNLTLDSSAENTISENNQDSIESGTSINSRISRSKAANIKKMKMELNQNTHRIIDESASELNTSVEITSLSTPSRTRRSTSTLNNSTSSIKHKILFTGIKEDYSKIIKKLGGTKVEDPAKCTILVTDKVRRTYKFLCALAKGVPIVAIDWLRDSEATAQFLDWENYILKDPVAEAKFGFRLRKSLDKAKNKKLLDGYIVVLTPCIAPPPIEELKDMVSSCGGKAVLRPPTKWPEKAVVLSREEDLPNARKFLAKAPKTVTVQSTEFILTGILRQETDFDKYKLT